MTDTSEETNEDTIYLFSQDEVDGDKSMKDLLGGKGANLAEMCSIGLPVPPGITIPTTVCREYMGYGPEAREALLKSVMDGVMQGLHWMEEKLGRKTLVSVRSGAPVSMPGMMDTILNVGLTKDTHEHFEKLIGKRAMLDSYRRLIQMMGATAYGIDMKVFDDILDHYKKEHDVWNDKDLTPDMLSAIIHDYRMAFEEHTGHAFPDTVEEQLMAAVRAVFDSWNNERAIEYRKYYGISDAMGTAVNVQSMVFGNMNDASGTGVAFTRNPSTGENVFMGEFLINAQGEDVVAGIRTPEPVENMLYKGGKWKGLYTQLLDIGAKLEEHYHDMMDIEFTVEDGKLWMLQCRTGKRSAQAALTIALDQLGEGTIDGDTFWKRVTRDQYLTLSKPVIDPDFNTGPNLTGLPASPGIGTGLLFTSSDALLQFKTDNPDAPVILVTKETDPDDMKAMIVSAGVLTSTGGATSHAAVVARGMDKPCVVGATGMNFTSTGEVCVNGQTYDNGSSVTIDGGTGRVWFGIKVPVSQPVSNEGLGHLRELALQRVGGIEIVEDFSGDLPKICYVTYDDLCNQLHRTKALEHAKAGHKVVLDLADPREVLKGPPAALAELLQPMDITVGVSNEMIKALTDVKFPHGKGPTVVGHMSDAQRKKLTTAGYTTAGSPKNMDEYLSMGFATITEEFIMTVFGSKEAYTAVNEALVGHFGSTAVPSALGSPMTKDCAVFTALKG